jgi:hypothetical protein
MLGAPLEDGKNGVQLPIELPVRSSFWITVGALSVVFLGAGGWLVLHAEDFPRHALVWLSLVGWSAIAFALLGLWGACWMGISSRAGLRLDAAGLCDHTSLNAAGFVPWSEIRGLRVVDQGRAALYVVIDLHDAAAFLQRFGRLKRWMLKSSAWITGSPVNLLPRAIGLQGLELAELIERAHRAAIAEADPLDLSRELASRAER